MDLFDVEVIENDPMSPAVTLRLTAVHPDENTFCLAKPFVLMLLEHADDAGVTDDSVERPDPDVWEEAGNRWYDYVESVEIVETAHFPRQEPPASLSGDDLDDWRDDHRPRATYRVTFVAPEWGAHLPVGARWGSTAYDELETDLFYEPPA